MKKLGFFKKLKWPLVIVIILAIVWFFFIREKSLTVTVRKTSLQNRVVRRTLTASGIVKSNSQSDLSFQITGKVSKIYVSKGDQVTKGKLLASLNTSIQLQTIDSYKNAMDAETRIRDLFIRDMDKNKEALGGEDQYKIKLKEYGDNIDQAKASYYAALNGLSNMNIYAPFSGTITAVTKDPGETAAVGDPFLTLVDLNSLLFTAGVDQADYGLLRVGQAAEVKLDTFANQAFNGKVLSLPLFTSISTGNFDVDIAVEGVSDKQVRLGMLGDTNIILETTGVAVPSLTVDEVSYDEADKPYVWVIENQKIKRMPVEITIEGDIYVSIKNEISQTIVVSAVDGQKMIEGYTAKIIN